MRTRYEPLISMQVDHNYFPDKFFDAFELIPVENTRQAIRQQGLLARKSRNNWFLFYQSEGPRKTDIDTLLDKEFTFIIKISDSSFSQYTNADAIPVSAAIQFYAATIDNRFFSTSRFIEEVKFDYTIQHTERPVNLKLQLFKGDVLKDVAVVEPSVKTYSFDVSATGEQAYDISENTLPITEEKKREIFVYKNYLSDRFYGMIYFKVFPAEAANSNRYTLVFEKK
jgi:hypothetical protein